tara:strand:+ start:1808 stop:2812 length:1005 start_codon:yes stop_codon:yes gene_type:complete
MGNIQSFEKKNANIYNHYCKYWNDSDIVDISLRWEEGNNINMIHRRENLPGTINHGLHKGKPLFEVLDLDKSFEEGGTCISKSTCGKYLAILPAHNGTSTDPKTPYNLQHIKTNISPRGIQCPCHVLVLQNPKHPDYHRPQYYNGKPLKRCYNAVTLRKKDIDEINNMSEFRNNVQKMLLNGSDEMVGSLRWWFSRKGQIILPNGTSVSEELTENDFIPEHRYLFHKIKNGKIDEVITHCMKECRGTYHLYDNMSIGWLHEHGDIPFHTINYQIMDEESNQKNEVKNVDVEKIKRFIHYGIPDKLYQEYIENKNKYIKQSISPVSNSMNESIYN